MEMEGFCSRQIGEFRLPNGSAHQSTRRRNTTETWRRGVEEHEKKLVVSDEIVPKIRTDSSHTISPKLTSSVRCVYFKIAHVVYV